MWPARRCARRTASAWLITALRSLDQENPPYTSTIREFADGGSIRVPRMRDLADAREMGLGGSLVIAAAVLAAMSASSFPGIPLCPGVHRRVVGPGRALRSHLG